MTPDQTRRMAEEDEAFERWYAKECPIKHSINVRLAARHAWKAAIAAALVKLTQGQEPIGRVLMWRENGHATWSFDPGQAAYGLPMDSKDAKARGVAVACEVYTRPIPSQQEERVREWVMESDIIKLQGVAETLERAGEKIVPIMRTARNKELGK